MQRPQVLDALVDVARIQSTEASNAIEDVVAPRKRIEALVEQKTKPRNRSEAEIAGYRAVLDLIHEQAPSIPFRPSVVEQLHRDLYQYTTRPGGPLEDDRERDRGGAAGRHQAASASGQWPQPRRRRRWTSCTPLSSHAREAGEHHPLLLIGCYVFDFLAIHPFRDGNGRMARLLTLLLLYQSGYGVGRYVSLERLVNDAKEGYYDVAAGGRHRLARGPAHDLAVARVPARDPPRRLSRVRGSGRATQRRPRGEDGIDRALRPRPPLRRVHDRGSTRGRARSQRFAHRQGARPSARRGCDRAAGDRTLGALATTLSESDRLRRRCPTSRWSPPAAVSTAARGQPRRCRNVTVGSPIAGRDRVAQRGVSRALSSEIS